MLRELWIENLALIEKAHVVFSPGFTVLTGETGSGKSLVVGALDLVLGARVRPETVRKGASHAYVAACFNPVPEDLQHLALEDSLLITRTISSEGKSKVTLNDRPATLKRLREIGEHLADLHGQHEQQSILKPETQRRLLDAYAKAGEQLTAYGEARSAFRDLQSRLDQFLEESRRGNEEREFWSYQLAELNACELCVGKEEGLMAERRRISGASKVAESLQEAGQMLEDSSDSVGTKLASALTALEAAARIDPKLDQTLNQLEEARVLIDDASRDLSHHLDTLESDPERLAMVEEALAQLAALKRKHKTDEAGLVALREELTRRLENQNNARHVEEEMREQLDAYAQIWFQKARALTRTRARGAARLAKDINFELRTLGMPEAKLRAVLSPASQGDTVSERLLGSQGAEDVVFHLTPNPGEPGGPLASIASGGELSRVMLALKNILRKVDPVPVVLFDEVDTGIGGLVAEAVGERLARIADSCQVIVVTHSALIAGMARYHLLLTKTSGQRTTIHIDAIEGTEREKEVARMLAGSSLESARPAAKTLLRDHT